MSDIRVVNLPGRGNFLDPELETKPPEVQEIKTVVELKEREPCCKPTCGTAKISELIYLIKNNYLSEFDTEEEKELARKNLDLYSKEDILNLLSLYFNKEEINTLLNELKVQSDWNESDDESLAYILNKPNFSQVAFSGSYNDLLNKPTGENIPIDSNNESISIAKVIEDNEEVVAAALNDLNSRLNQIGKELVFWNITITKTNSQVVTDKDPIPIVTSFGGRKWDELKAIQTDEKLLVLNISLNYDGNSSRVMIPCTIRDGGAVMWVTGVTNIEGSEIELTCQQNKTGASSPSDYKISASGYIYYHAKDTISTDFINNLN